MITTDVLISLVIGAGPAGLSAALAAAQGGAAVLLADLSPGPGGQIWRGATAADGGEASELLRRGSEAQPNITALYGAQAALTERGTARAADVVQFSTPQGPRRVLAHKIILASGATERFLPFPGWTLPGVVGAGGLQAMVKSGLDVRGARVLVAGSGPLLLAVAAGLRAAGAEVRRRGRAGQPARSFWASRLARPAQRQAGRGRQAALGAARRAVLARDLSAAGRAATSRLERVTLGGLARRTLACDWLAAGFGLVPDTRLAALFGCELSGGAVRVGAWQHTSSAGHLRRRRTHRHRRGGQGPSGRLRGRLRRHRADRAAARSSAADGALPAAFRPAWRGSFALRPAPANTARSRHPVCRCEDVPHAALQALPVLDRSQAPDPLRHGHLSGAGVRPRRRNPLRLDVYGRPATAFAAFLSPTS